MTHIIALRGPGSSGKTSTLIRVFEGLLVKYPTATVQALHGRTADIKILLRGVNGKVVGIESQGDPNSRLQKSLAEFISAECDIIFCACRTSGMTANWISELSPPHNVQFVNKARALNSNGGADSAVATSLITLAGL